MISPLPNLPMTCAGGGLVLNAMVSVLPEAVASMTLDWSGPTTKTYLPPPLIVSARSFTASFAAASL